METRPRIGEKLKPKKTIKSIKLSVKDIHTVTDVKKADCEFPENDGYWWVRTDLLGDEWYAISHFLIAVKSAGKSRKR